MRKIIAMLIVFMVIGIGILSGCTTPNEAKDTDGDGYPDNIDVFPNDATQWADGDYDGYGDNSNGANPDVFPDNIEEWKDSDSDGIGDNSDIYPYDFNNGEIDQSFFSRSVAVKGERYESLVPDTLDLQERAELAINALTRCTNPENNYSVYFYGDIHRNPPVLFRQESLYGKFMEGLVLMRIITGSQLNKHVDQRWREMFLRWLIESKSVLYGPDGGRQLAWMAINYRLEKDPCWGEITEQALDSILSAVVNKSDYCYFPDDQGAMPTGWNATYHAWNLQGVTQLYLLTGSSTAKELAAKLARYLKDYGQVFDGNGHFLARHPSEMGPALHFHHNANALLAISEYALATGDDEFAAFAKKGYEYARSTGSPLVGFFPEYIDDWPDNRTIVDCETCCVADMILLALTLTDAGQGDYWDDVDRYVRNQFAENQMRRGDWIDQIATALPPTSVGLNETGDHISERAIGSFAGWAIANDFHNGGSIAISACCTGNGARALYYVWEKIVRFKNGTLSVNLLLNRASPWADVDSYIPYEGRVDVRMKQICNLEIRIPEWARPEETSCTVDGQSRELTFQGRYAQVGRVENGSQIVLTFPISERTVEATIGGIPYTLIIKGNDVVSIDPPGELYPLYQRVHYRDNHVHWVKRERFILTNFAL